MDDLLYRECLDAIRARVEVLPKWRGVNSPAAARAGLLSAAFVTDALARRYIRPMSPTVSGVARFQSDAWLLQWYIEYCEAVRELGTAIQTAAKDGALTLRSSRTRAPLGAELADWLAADLRAEVSASKLFPECAKWNPLFDTWPDAVPIPPGAMDADSADAWAVTAGIAQAGEVLALAAAAPKVPTATAAAPGAAPAEDEPEPLTTGHIAHCFQRLKWGEAEWKKALGNMPKWLGECLAVPGKKGVSERRWNPVCIGAALVRNGHAKQNSVRARFQTVPILEPWREAWKTYEADHFDDV